MKALITLIILSLVFLFNCSKYKEEAPFFDGLTLEYKWGLMKKVYEVKDIDKGFRILQTRVSKGLGNKTEEFFVDEYGKVYKSTEKAYVGHFSPMWIPVNKMDVGSEYNDGFTIIKKDRWKIWDVLVSECPMSGEKTYFEANTGYLVGKKGKGYEIYLINTNADIPTIEE